ncbi:hypothetical protein NEDG_02277, partial [Nematocida displodere]
TDAQMKQILTNCQTCLGSGPEYVRPNSFIATNRPGEIVGIDLLQTHGKCVIVAIDYFTRKLFTKSRD